MKKEKKCTCSILAQYCEMHRCGDVENEESRVKDKKERGALEKLEQKEFK